jgi:hypothetical protein
MAQIPVSSCSVFIQVWVDTNALQNGSTRGVYLVDNRLNNGSANEGTVGLQTAVTNNSNICWQVFNIDPNSSTTLSIASIGNSSAWGASGQPESVTPNTFTGQVQATGHAEYKLTINAQAGGGSGITTSVSPGVSVS